MVQQGERDMKQILVELEQSAPLVEQMSEVLEAWQSGRYMTLLIHIFSGVPDEERLVSIAKELEACCNTRLIAGTISAGEIKDGHVIEPGILVSAMLFEKTCVDVILIHDIKGHERTVGAQVRDILNGVRDLKGAELLFPGTETDTEQMFVEISDCRKEIAIFGGYPGGHQVNAPEHFIFNQSGAMYNSMMVITYAGKDLYIDVDKSIGWQALGLPFKVTKAQGKHLIELEGKPSAEIYEKFLQIDRRKHNNAEDALEFPLLARDDNEEEYLRSVAHIEQDGSMWLDGFVTEGMDIHLTYGDPSRIFETVNQRLATMQQFRPQAILLYTCVVRKTFWKDLADLEMLPFAQMCCTGGFHTWGEIIRGEHTGKLCEHNVTILSIGLREGEPQGEPIEVRIDDTALQGQASLLNRMTRMVYAAMDELQNAYAKLKIMGERDALTGIYNRGMTERLINDALDQGERPLSLIMSDIDHFKRVNDTYGHSVGDEVLCDIAQLLKDSINGYRGAVTGRWGGEEFFVMLPGVDENGAMDYAERLRLSVCDHCFPGAGHLTISQGVITVRGRDEQKLVYKQVDDALYRAKESGRNRVVTA